MRCYVIITKMCEDIFWQVTCKINLIMKLCTEIDLMWPIRPVFIHLRACSHGGGGPQVGEVPHLLVVKEC